MENLITNPRLMLAQQSRLQTLYQPERGSNKQHSYKIANSHNSRWSSPSTSGKQWWVYFLSLMKRQFIISPPTRRRRPLRCNLMPRHCSYSLTEKMPTQNIPKTKNKISILGQRPFMYQGPMIHKEKEAPILLWVKQAVNNHDRWNMSVERICYRPKRVSCDGVAWMCIHL